MMSKKKIADLPDFDPVKFLKDDEDIAAYLTVVIEENDPSLLAAALGDLCTICFYEICCCQQDGRFSSIHLLTLVIKNGIFPEQS